MIIVRGLNEFSWYERGAAPARQTQDRACIATQRNQDQGAENLVFMTVLVSQTLDAVAS